MNEALRALVNGLALEKLEENLFRGALGDTLVKRVYGGKVLGEALTAAQMTVDERPVHSLHAYFLREADSFQPVIYSVDRSRDGKSFSARRVTAIQHGQPIFTLEASFQKLEAGVEFQRTMPEVPAPETITPVRWDWDKFDALSTHDDDRSAVRDSRHRWSQRQSRQPRHTDSSHLDKDH